MANKEQTLLALLRRYDAMLNEALCPKTDFEDFDAWIEARRALLKEALPWLTRRNEESDGSTKAPDAH